MSGLGLSDRFPESSRTVADTLLEPTRIYVRSVLGLLERGLVVSAMAHITGGGMIGNLGRVVPDGLSARLDFSEWDVPPVFRTIQRLGDISDRVMFDTFNMGIGYVLVVLERDGGARRRPAGGGRRRGRSSGRDSRRNAGNREGHSGRALVRAAGEADPAAQAADPPGGGPLDGPPGVSRDGEAGATGARPVFRLAVLASGSGTNLQAIIDQLHGRPVGPPGDPARECRRAGRPAPPCRPSSRWRWW